MLLTRMRLPLCLMFPSTGRASAGLDRAVEQLPVVRMINF